MLDKKVGKKISGMTLIETLVVITVGLTVIALALTVYNSVSNKLNVKSETENLSIMYSGVRDLFSEEPLNGDSGIDNELLVSAGVIPDKMKVIGGDTIKNTWGGDVTFDALDEYNFTVTYEDVKSGSVCIDLVRNQRKIGWGGATVGGTDVDYSAIVVSDLTTACEGTNGKVEIVFSTETPAGTP